jgi:secreted trypsin-like serine protease
MGHMRARSLSIFISSSLAFTACGPAESSLWDADAQDEQAIINGEISDGSSFKSAGALLIRGTDSYGYPIDGMCTGTLIAPDVVLTAGHCRLDEAEYGTSGKYYFSFALDVQEAGETLGGMPKHTYGVKKIVRHPRFDIPESDGLGHANDIAIAFLRRSVVGVEPASVLKPDEADILQSGLAADIVGYGLRTAPEMDPDASDIGVKAQAKSVINEVGKYEIQVGVLYPTPQKCYGDSGGPTYITLQDGSERLVGVTSRAYDDSGCTKGGVDTRADAYFAWLKSTAKKACKDGTRRKCHPLP